MTQFHQICCQIQIKTIPEKVSASNTYVLLGSKVIGQFLYFRESPLVLSQICINVILLYVFVQFSRIFENSFHVGKFPRGLSTIYFVRSEGSMPASFTVRAPFLWLVSRGCARNISPNKKVLGSSSFSTSYKIGFDRTWK